MQFNAQGIRRQDGSQFSIEDFVVNKDPDGQQIAPPAAAPAVSSGTLPATPLPIKVQTVSQQLAALKSVTASFKARRRSQVYTVERTGNGR